MSTLKNCISGQIKLQKTRVGPTTTNQKPELAIKNGRLFATHLLTNSSKDRRSLTTRKSILFFDFLL